MNTIPRDLVAELLDASPDDLPDGDLPVGRLAKRWHGQLQQIAAEQDPAEDWAGTLMLRLPSDAPDHAWAVILATLDLCQTPADVAVLAAGPTEDLLAAHGPAIIDRIEDAARAPRVRYLLSGVWKDGIPPLLWARIVAARAGGPDLDEGDPLPAA